MPYDIKLLGSAAKELRNFRVYDQRRISDEIENHLRHQPMMESRNCCLRASCATQGTWEDDGGHHMKEVALEQLTEGTGELFETAQRERVLVTRNGLPFAVVVGIENKDEEDFRLESSPEFWQMIEERRRE